MSRTEVQSDVGEIAHGPCTANVTWKIKDFFQLPRTVDLCLQSPPFSFLDATWFLELWPNGESKNKSERWISLSLFKMHSDTLKHQIQYTVGIAGPDGSMIKEIETEDEFDRNNEGYGWVYFYKQSLLQEKRNEIAPEGVLKVVCSMRANTRGGVEASAQTEATSGVKELVNNFKDLLSSEEATDVTLNVKNREYKVHRAVLIARSSVFAAMLKHDMKEKNSGLIEIDDCDPVAFKQFLTYVYTGNLDKVSMETVLNLFHIAHKYNTQDLKAYCIQFMMDHLSVEIFCDVLLLALKYDESELLQKATEFFAKNLMNVLVTPKWLTFVKENPVESNELHIKAVKYYAEDLKCITPSGKESKSTDKECESRNEGEEYESTDEEYESTDEELLFLMIT